MLLAQALDVITKNTGLFIGILIVLVLPALMFKDLARFSLTRVRAIASVCFTQAIRRRVLWVTPLVIVGILIVSQFQKSLDAQDQVRQITTYCLFATGMLVTMLTIILACTNIPREVETRVIYTVATKPVTRLEIVLGKVLGFVYVSFWVLVIMGAFSLAYLYYLDASNRRAIANQLAAKGVPAASIPTYSYYQKHGTLHARVFERPDSLDVLARLPKDENDRWAGADRSGAEMEIIVPFEIDRDRVPKPRAGPASPGGPIGPGIAPDAGGASPGGLLIQARFRARRVMEKPAAAPTTAPTTAPTSQPWEVRQPPQLAVELRSGNNESIVFTKDLEGGARELPEGGGLFNAYVAPQHVDRWLAGANPARVNVVFWGGSEQHEVSLEPGDSVQIVSFDGTVAFKPIAAPRYAGVMGQYGQKLRGAKEGSGRVAVYAFRDVDATAGRSSYPFELRAGIELNRSDDDLSTEANELRLTFVNRKNGHRETVEVFPESNRPSYFDVPAAAVEGGNFDVQFDLRSPAWIGLQLTPATASLRMVRGDQSFAFNLLKSLTVLWLLSLLVTIISVFCSTFLSWPIAVILTLLFLTGRWGAEQLGDIAKPGIGRQIAQDMFRKSNAGTQTAVSETVDALVQALNLVAGFLPDISRFAAMEHIDRGIAIPAATLKGSLLVTFGYGLPLLVLGWFLLRQKEVAP